MVNATVPSGLCFTCSGFLTIFVQMIIKFKNKNKNTTYSHWVGLIEPVFGLSTLNKSLAKNWMGLDYIFKPRLEWAGPANELSNGLSNCTITFYKCFFNSLISHAGDLMELLIFKNILMNYHHIFYGFKCKFQHYEQSMPALSPGSKIKTSQTCSYFMRY